MKNIFSGRRAFTWMIAITAFAIAGTAFGDPYTLDTCPISGGKLGTMGDPIIKNYDGQEVRFCCSGCPKKFEADKASYQAKIDAKVIAQQKPFYPLETCLIGDHKLGAMGEVVDHVYQNRLLRYCSEGDKDTFVKDPKKYLKKLDAAVVEKQKAAYPLDTCLVSGEKLGGSMGDPIDHVIANRLVRLCCKGCVKKIEKNPSKFLAALDKAMQGNATHKSEGSESHGHGGSPMTRMKQCCERSPC